MREKGLGQTGVIDMHAHWYPEGSFEEILRNQPDFNLVALPSGGQRLTFRDSLVMSVPPGQADLEMRIATMDRLGIATEILSVGALNIGWAGSSAATTARRINDALAEVCRQSSGRFRFVAVLPLEKRMGMIKELERALGLGAVGVGITTTVGDKTLDALELREFWHEVSSRALTVLVHPTFPPNGPSHDQGQFLTTGYLGETAFAATRLVLAGVLEDYPGARVVWSHLGGGLPMLVDRLDRTYKRFVKCPRPPTFYLRQCFYDTACTHGPALDCAHATFGPGALLFGTDEPHVPNASEEVLAALRDRAWPVAELELVLSGNARQVV